MRKENLHGKPFSAKALYRVILISPEEAQNIEENATTLDDKAHENYMLTSINDTIARRRRDKLKNHKKPLLKVVTATVVASALGACLLSSHKDSSVQESQIVINKTVGEMEQGEAGCITEDALSIDYAQSKIVIQLDFDLLDPTKTNAPIEVLNTAFGFNLTSPTPVFPYSDRQLGDNTETVAPVKTAENNCVRTTVYQGK